MTDATIDGGFLKIATDIKSNEESTLGEKGIGRLAAQRLGTALLVETSSDKENHGLAAHREELKALLKDMLGEQYVSQFGIHKAGNSAVLRLVAPKYLDWQIPFEEQIDVVEDHLRLVALLCETAKQIDRERLIAFYAVAAPEKLK